MRFIFLKLDEVFRGNASELGDVSVNSWKNYLFFLTDYRPGIGLSRERASSQEEQPTFWAVRCVHDDQ